MRNKELSLSSQLSPDELKQIKVFNNRVKKLASNSLFQDGFKPAADLQITSEGASFRFELPSEEAFESLLMRFRHFWLEKEPCSFNRVRNIVHRYLPGERERTENLKRSWKQGLFHSVHVVNDGVELTSKELIDIWLNAEFFHNQEVEKDRLSELIEKIESINSPDLVKFFLIGSVIECCFVIFELNKLIEEVF